RRPPHRDAEPQAHPRASPRARPAGGAVMTPVSLLATASYFPPRVVDNDFFALDPSSSRGAMFRGSKHRRHVDADETAVSMIARAAANLGPEAKDVDLILTNVTCPDLPFTGCGASVAHAIGATPRLVLDLHNSGCVSFVYMMKVASALIRAGEARTALLCNVQN